MIFDIRTVYELGGEEGTLYDGALDVFLGRHFGESLGCSFYRAGRTRCLPR